MSLKRRLSVRSSVDLKDGRQVRALKKRFRVAEQELSRIVERAGASIAAFDKEAALQRAGRLPQPAETLSAAVIAATDSGAETVPAGGSRPA
jgi:hypothetical protein